MTKSLIKKIVSTGLKVFLLLMITAPLYAEPTDFSISDTTFFKLYNQTVEIINRQSSRTGLHFLLVTTEESRYDERLTRTVLDQAGSITEVRFRADEIVTLETINHNYKFHSRNLFTSRGLYASLLAEGGLSNQEILDSISKLTQQIFNNYFYKKRKSLVVTINTVEKNDPSASVLSKYFNPKTDSKNYIAVTEELCYNYLKQSKVNTVLKSKDISDDGSILAYSGQNNIPYIGICFDGNNFKALSSLIIQIKHMIRALYPGYF